MLEDNLNAIVAILLIVIFVHTLYISYKYFVAKPKPTQEYNTYIIAHQKLEEKYPDGIGRGGAEVTTDLLDFYNETKW